MVDKGPCAACTDTIHALFHIVIEIGDFGIFTAKFNSSVCCRQIFFDSCCTGNDFLHKRQIQAISNTYASRACNYYRKW